MAKASKTLMRIGSRQHVQRKKNDFGLGLFGGDQP
jgi:hypothetical protein